MTPDTENKPVLSKDIAVLLWQVFELGVNHGQLIMEEERDAEDVADAFANYNACEKYLRPSMPIERRKPHSEEWRNAKKDSLQRFFDIVVSQYPSKEE
jgi:hypothetical protein